MSFPDGTGLGIELDRDRAENVTSRCTYKSKAEGIDHEFDALGFALHRPQPVLPPAHATAQLAPGAPTPECLHRPPLYLDPVQFEELTIADRRHVCACAKQSTIPHRAPDTARQRPRRREPDLSRPVMRPDTITPALLIVGPRLC